MDETDKTQPRRIGSDAAIRSTKSPGLCGKCVFFGSWACQDVCVTVTRRYSSDPFSMDYQAVVSQCDKFQEEKSTVEELQK